MPILPTSSSALTAGNTIILETFRGWEALSVGKNCALVSWVKTRVSYKYSLLHWYSDIFSKLGHTGGKVKADEWCNSMLVYLVAPFEAWRKGDELPDGDAPNPKEGTKAYAQWETVNLDDFQTSQNYQDQYEAILLFCAAICIFTS